MHRYSQYLIMLTILVLVLVTLNILLQPVLYSPIATDLVEVEKPNSEDIERKMDDLILSILESRYQSECGGTEDIALQLRKSQVKSEVGNTITTSFYLYKEDHTYVTTITSVSTYDNHELKKTVYTCKTE